MLPDRIETAIDFIASITIAKDQCDTNELARQAEEQGTPNAPLRDHALYRCVPQLIADQASATPEAIAVTKNGHVLSYRELNERANQLAHSLRALGVERNSLVALCMERGVDLVIGLLGILKAGAAYVPLDPTYPAERLAFMLADSAAPVVVTQQHLVSRLPAHTAQSVCLESTMLQDVSDPVVAQTGDDLAYVIYTSGSTGRPKGVQITHSSLLNLVFWHQRTFEVTAADRATQLTSPAFDATGWEIWPYLTAGASISMPDEDARTSAPALRNWLLDNNITISFVPTALAESLFSFEWPPTTSLRYLLTGADTLQRYPAHTLPFALINNYGPTEATVVTTSGRVHPTPNVQTPPTIGRPIDNMQVYILDEQLHQVPLGTPGELYIGGAGLARGYLNRPELTAERFIRHPFSPDPEARLYKTGDRARILDDGQIAFLGRTDHQIKIRGYRIEPGEVMAVLNEHPAVQTSIVVARKDTSDENRLVAYIVKVPDA
ncbi:MAG TPA: amino acid adenylation domain-containing protein [Ktedonobacteraceae bacterium]|nr:amino acid adenylation domain-containing protein [Ktedonobacteraceae bacterium]